MGGQQSCGNAGIMSYVVCKGRRTRAWCSAKTMEREGAEATERIDAAVLRSNNMQHSEC